MNEKFGTDFTDADKLSRDQLNEDMMQDEGLAEKACNNTMDNFAFSFKDLFMDFVVDCLGDKNFYMKTLENEEIRTYLMNDMLEEVYHGLRERL